MSSGSEELKKFERMNHINQIYEQHRSYTLNYFQEAG